MKLNQRMKLQFGVAPIMEGQLLWGIYGATVATVLLVVGSESHLFSTAFLWLGWSLCGVFFGLVVILMQRVQALAAEQAHLCQQLHNAEGCMRQVVEQVAVVSPHVKEKLSYTIDQAENMTRKQAEVALVQANAALEQKVKQQTAELATSQAQMQAILDHIPAAIYIDGLDGRLQFVNTQWQKLFGSADENPLGRHLSEIIVPERAAILIDENQSVAALGEAMTFEQEAVLPNGVHTYLKVKFPLQAPTGEINAVCGISIDITERKQMEMALKASEQQLQALTCQLQKQNEQLEEVSRLKSEFLTNMSHELRTPLTSILGFSDVLLQRIFGSLTAKQEEYLSRIHSSGEHLLDLINDLLDLAKIEAGRMELYLELVDPAELCQAAIQMVEVRALAKQQQMCLELPMAIESVIVDRQRVIQILLNYLSNAIKFTPAGGTISLTSRLSSNLDLAVQHSTAIASNLVATTPKGFLVLSVSDTGIGIPLEKQHLLFQTFQQIDGAMDRHYEGSGLGLALTRRLAELHGGTVSLNSVPDVGSTFSVWLPLLESVGESGLTST